MGIERKLCMLFSDVLSVLKHHLSTRHGISREHYSVNSVGLDSTGQGNSLSRVVYRD